jgi:ankyrin repeat protein
VHYYCYLLLFFLILLRIIIILLFYYFVDVCVSAIEIDWNIIIECKKESKTTTNHRSNFFLVIPLLTLTLTNKIKMASLTVKQSEDSNISNASYLSLPDLLIATNILPYLTSSLRMLKTLAAFARTNKLNNKLCAPFIKTLKRISIRKRRSGEKNFIVSCVADGNLKSLKIFVNSGFDCNQVAKLIRKNKASLSLTPIGCAAFCNHEDIVKYLLNEPSVDVNKGGAHNWSPLWIASFQGHYNLVKLLLDYQSNDVNKNNKCINIEQTDIHGETALSKACSKGHVEIVKLLIDRGADVFHLENNGESCLLQSTPLGHIDVMEILLKHGADINQQSIIGLTPLIFASTVPGLTHVVEYLLSRQHDIQLNINFINCKGESALLCAVKENRFTIVELLINHPTFNVLLINATDPVSNKSLIDICNDNNYTNMKELLEQFIADRNLNEIFTNLNVTEQV